MVKRNPGRALPVRWIRVRIMVRRVTRAPAVWSVIIGTTSEQAYDPSPDLYDYAQTKAATMNYVKSLAKQLGPKGIRVNGVAPGPIWTP
jgi:NAD(P)-dependent dehydrogenase (short-subunit alcohol dehydrogenase family)